MERGSYTSSSHQMDLEIMTSGSTELTGKRERRESDDDHSKDEIQPHHHNDNHEIMITRIIITQCIQY